MELLSKDYAIGKAMATRDAATIQSLAWNLKGRSQASFVWFLDREGRVIADSERKLAPGEIIREFPALKESIQGKVQGGISVLNNTPYQMAFVPLRHPGLESTIVGGFQINQDFSSKLKKLSRSEISFSVGDQLVLSTLDPPSKEVLSRELANLSSEGKNTVGPKGNRHVVISLALSPNLKTHIQNSLDDALIPLKNLQRMLLIVGLAGFLISAFLGYFLSGRITASIQDLIFRLRKSNDELTKLNELKEKFFAMVVHDVNNPLQVIYGTLSLLKKKVTSPDFLEYINQGVKSAKRLGLIVSDLVDFAAIEAGIMKFKMEPINFIDVVKDVQGRIEILAHQKNITFSVENESEKISMIGDPQRLNQVLQNLCGNALHYTPKGGKIELKVENESGHIKFSVRDNGIGISTEALPHVFETYYQSKEAKKLRPSGFGLGLRIVTEIIKGHDGKIRVDSELGEGTTFFVSLPIHEDVESDQLVTREL